MHPIVGLLPIVLALASSGSWAFAPCDRLADNAARFADNARLEAIGRAPVKYLGVAEGIELRVDTGDEALIPYASERPGKKQVVLPLAFARLSCQMALATYLSNEGIGSQAYERAARRAAGCIDAGKAPRGCLIALGNELGAQLRGSFEQQPPVHRAVAEDLATQALWQVVQHEYAHHFLQHFARIGSRQTERIDAEFEADLYAITNGIQAGEAPSAMYYFFDGLALVESASRSSTVPDYESSTCRANNVDDIAGFLGIVPIVLVNAAAGGRLRSEPSSPDTLRRAVQQHFGKAVPSLKAHSCARIATAALPDTYAELKQLALRLQADADLLYASGQTLDNARAARLLADLTAMASKFRYMDGVTTKCIAYMLLNWGWQGRGRTPLMAAVDRLLDDPKVAGNLQGKDFGRIRSAQGLAVLQERTDLGQPLRLDRAYALLSEAVRYNPHLSEAWMNLAFISFKRGDCATAADHADRAVQTHTPSSKDDADATVFFARSMRGMAADAQACRSRAAAFKPYPGL